MGKPFISQNITLATGGFTYENGILTPAEAKTIYNLNVPSNVLVSANGLLWIKLNSTKTAAQIGWTDVDGTTRTFQYLGSMSIGNLSGGNMFSAPSVVGTYLLSVTKVSVTVSPTSDNSHTYTVS